MIQDLIKKALQEKGGDILGGFDLSGDKKEKAMDLAKDTVMDEVTSQFTSGNLAGIKNAFSQGSSSSLVQTIISKYGSQLVGKLGLNPSLANSISGSLIPMIFDFIDKKDDAPTGSESGIKDMIGGALEGAIGNKLGGMLKGKFGF